MTGRRSQDQRQGLVISYKKTLEEASEKSNALVKYATELYQPSKTKSLSFIVKVLPSLSDAGIKVWQEYQKAARERRDEIKKDLDNLKWKAFDEIFRRKYVWIQEVFYSLPLCFELFSYYPLVWLQLLLLKSRRFSCR